MPIYRSDETYVYILIYFTECFPSPAPHIDHFKSGCVIC